MLQEMNKGQDYSMQDRRWKSDLRIIIKRESLIFNKSSISLNNNWTKNLRMSEISLIKTTSWRRKYKRSSKVNKKWEFLKKKLWLWGRRTIWLKTLPNYQERKAEERLIEQKKLFFLSILTINLLIIFYLIFLYF